MRLKAWFGALALLLSVVVVIGAVVASWYFAGMVDRGRHLRLRYYVVTTSFIRQGTRLGRANVRGHFGRLPSASEAFIPSIQDAVGHYAVHPLGSKQALDTTTIWAAPPTPVPAGGAVVALKLKAEDAVGLAPRMGLVFAKGEDKKVIEVPDQKQRKDSTLRRGLRLLSLTPFGKDSEIVTLMVSMPRSGVKFAPTLSVGDWKPIIIFQGPEW